MSMVKVKNICNLCMQITFHTVEGSHSYVSNPDDYQYEEVHSVVKCCGCDTVSFRRELFEIEAAYLTEYDTWEVPSNVNNYPKLKKGSINTDNIPEIVKDIYIETCNAYRDEAFTLAGIGFRSTIEAICNDQNIPGKELSTRINGLVSKGLISKKDSTRLHSIRFLGNDSAHDIKKPSTSSLDAALVIVEHLITTVYILDRDSKGKLDEVIDAYEKFESLLVKKLEDYNDGDEFPIHKFLGKDIRLMIGTMKNIEGELNSRIGKGVFTLLKFGKKEKYLNSKEELMHYIVKKI